MAVRFFLSVLFAAFLALPAQAQGIKDPAAFAHSLYKLPEMWQSIAQDPAARARWLSPTLNKLVSDNKKLDPENQLDYDALVDDQDYDVKDVSKVTVLSNAGGKASVQVDFINFGAQRKVTLELVTVAGGEWRLNDIKYEDDRTLADDLDFMNSN
jgi:hypothetical protein